MGRDIGKGFSARLNPFLVRRPRTRFLALPTQEEGTLVQTASGQQILLVTNPAQVMALQQLAIQQLEQQQALELDTGEESVLGEDVIITASAALDDD